MPQRHSKNNNDLAFFTYDEKRKLGYGTQRERLGKDSIKPFDACCLCLKSFIHPMSCQKGHVFCKECILQCLLSQKKDIQRKLAVHESQKKQEKEDEEEKLMLQKTRELEAFDQQNHGAVPQYNDRNQNRDKNGFHGANSVKVTSYEEEALRTMKAFWLPSATPEAPVKTEAPSTSTICPEGNEKLKMKSLFSIYLTEDNSEKKSSASPDKTYICPSCKVTLTNTRSLVALSSCGHVFCKKCADKFMAVDKVCLVCNKACKGRNLVNLEKGGTGFAGHGDNLLATDFKHLGCGSGLGLICSDPGPVIEEPVVANSDLGLELCLCYRFLGVGDCLQERITAEEGSIEGYGFMLSGPSMSPRPPPLLTLHADIEQHCVIFW